VSAQGVAAGWRGEPVALADVARVLERQRHEQEEEGHVRARVATLLVVADTEERARTAVRIVEALEGRNPSRCVVLLARPPDNGGGVRTWARVTPRRGRGVPGLRDEVVVEAAVPLGHLASVVLPLLLPDIPVFTWWLGTPPFGGELAEQLFAVTDRLIVDSGTFADPLADLGGLAASIGSLPPGSDCMWGRLTPWREQLASSFEPAAMRPSLGVVRHVRIAGVRPTAGVLLAGWMATRLGWSGEPAERAGRTGGWRARHRTPEGDAVVELHPAEGPNALASVEVECAGNATVLLQARGPHLVASTRIGRTEAKQTRVGQCGMTPAQALHGELEVFGRDRVFEEALAATTPWAGISWHGTGA
jgi:glucose-6-phosphate dehydrogenase assembly protein OpcA